MTFNEITIFVACKSVIQRFFSANYSSLFIRSQTKQINTFDHNFKPLDDQGQGGEVVSAFYCEDPSVIPTALHFLHCKKKSQK